MDQLRSALTEEPETVRRAASLERVVARCDDVVADLEDPLELPRAGLVGCNLGRA